MSKNFYNFCLLIHFILLKNQSINDKVIEIHEIGRVKRQEAEVQLEEIENKLKEKLLEIKN